MKDSSRYDESIMGKLVAEGVKKGDHAKAIEVLSRCILGKALVKIYKRRFMGEGE